MASTTPPAASQPLLAVDEGVCEAVVPDEPVAKPVVIYNFNKKEMARAANKAQGTGGEIDSEDEGDVDDDAAEARHARESQPHAPTQPLTNPHTHTHTLQAAMEVYLLHNEVIFKDGHRVAVEDFKCCATGESLLEQDFVIHEGQLYCRSAYLDLMADHVDASTMQPLQKGDNVVYAMGYRWKIENFCCSHTGKPLNFEEFMVRNGKPYSLSSFVELFRICPTCNEVVPFAEKDAIEWSGMIYHDKCFECALQHSTFAAKWI